MESPFEQNLIAHTDDQDDGYQKSISLRAVQHRDKVHSRKCL